MFIQQKKKPYSCIIPLEAQATDHICLCPAKFLGSYIKCTENSWSMFYYPRITYIFHCENNKLDSIERPRNTLLRFYFDFLIIWQNNALNVTQLN